MGLPQSYDLNNSIVKAGEVNLGLSHGLPSILKFCICCYKKNIQVEKAKKNAYKIIDFLVWVKSRAPGETFPNTISKRNQSPNSGSRLSWCYGDLSIGFILYQSGVAFNDSTITEFALDVMLNTIPRKSIGETNVRDAGFCHGSAGIAHIYNKMWHYTNNVLFKDACSFWIKETLDFSVNQDSPAGYKVYLKDEYPQLDSYGLLTGISGIGLALLSFINKEYDWDYCLMLNDE
jgi:lantibiotic modifying enzyme